MKIIAFSASNSRNSINKQLVTHAAEVFKTEIKPDADIETLDLNDYEMPIYSIDRERESGIPQLAQDFLDRIGGADALLISFAEHNGLYTAAFKNIFDWASRLEKDIYQHKPLVIMSTSPGRRGGANVMKIALEGIPRFGGDIRASFTVGKFGENFKDGRLTDPDLAQELRDGLSKLI